MKIRYQNGYSDGSGKGTIIKVVGDKEEPILRTHWGCSCCCSCCDRDTTKADNRLACEIVKILNEARLKKVKK